MCQIFDAPPTGADEFYVDSPAMRAFIDRCNAIRASGRDSSEIVDAIRPHFTELLADPDWLPAEFQEPMENSGMGSGIGMWLLYRAGDGGLAFSSLVVPPGAQTPVHDHLAWGIVGLYRGMQEEVVYRRVDDGRIEDRAVLDVREERAIAPGDMYELLPETDIHRVVTISDVTSVSLHLLGNDNGCIWRHRFLPDEDRVEPFKSGWLNVPCTSEEAATVAG